MESTSFKNYKAYNAGKEKLQNAVLLQPDDKINDFLKKKINHRFWVSNYNAFKKAANEKPKYQGLKEDAGAGQVMIGAGNPLAPTPISLGSGDKFQTINLKVKKKKKKVNEDFRAMTFESYTGDGIKFEDKIEWSDINLWNEAPEMGEIDSAKAFVKYTAHLDMNRAAIEGIDFTIDHITLHVDTIKFSPEDTIGDYPIEEPKTFEIPQPETETEINKLPLYITDLTIDMQKSMDPAKWTFKVQFGRMYDY